MAYISLKIGDYRLKLLNEMKSEDYMPSTSISDNSMTELFLKGNIKNGEYILCL